MVVGNLTMNRGEVVRLTLQPGVLCVGWATAGDVCRLALQNPDGSGAVVDLSLREVSCLAASLVAASWDLGGEAPDTTAWAVKP